MKLRHALAALAGAAAIASASAQEPRTAADQRMTLLREQMDRIRAEEDPKVRSQLIDQHILAMRRAMQPEVSDVPMRLDMMDLRMDVFELLLERILERLEDHAAGVRTRR